MRFVVVHKFTRPPRPIPMRKYGTIRTYSRTYVVIQIRSDPELFDRVGSGNIVQDPNLTLPRICVY
jgi:hypothetical protein